MLYFYNILLHDVWWYTYTYTYTCTTTIILINMYSIKLHTHIHTYIWRTSIYIYTQHVLYMYAPKDVIIYIRTYVSHYVYIVCVLSKHTHTVWYISTNIVIVHLHNTLLLYNTVWRCSQAFLGLFLPESAPLCDCQAVSTAWADLMHYCWRCHKCTARGWMYVRARLFGTGRGTVWEADS